MRLFYTFLFVVFLVTTSFGQSFSLPDLIKMAKMDKDSFDTYVSSKKFVFLREINQDKIIGVTYGLNASSSGDGSAEKYITLYSKFLDVPVTFITSPLFKFFKPLKAL